MTATATATGTAGERAAAGSPPGAAPLLRTGERSTVRVDLTPRASRQIRALLAAREPQTYGLRLTVDEAAATDGAGGANVHDHGGSRTPGTVYLLSLAPLPHDGDLVLARNGFDVYVPQRHAARLDGVRIDFVESSATAGFLIDPPARPPRPRRPGAEGAVPGAGEVVAAVQDAIAQVRPALQADGGDLTLVAVEDGVAVVELVGACSACSSALVTLTELVERVIVAAVPAIESVVLA